MEYLLLALATLSASTLTGTVGVGGALLVVPLLTVTADLLGLIAPEIRFIGYLMNFVSLMPVVRRNWTKIDFAMAHPLVASSILGGLIGATLPHLAGERALLWAFVACLTIVLVLLLRRLGDTAPPRSDFILGRRERIIVGAVGFAVGLASGLFGIGGGVLMLPLVVMLLGIKPTSIILLTPLTVLFSTGTGIAVTLWHGMPPLHAGVAVTVVMAAMAGASLGDRLRGRLSDRHLLLVVVAILSVLVVKMGFRAAGMA